MSNTTTTCDLPAAVTACYPTAVSARVTGTYTVRNGWRNSEHALDRTSLYALRGPVRRVEVTITLENGRTRVADFGLLELIPAPSNEELAEMTPAEAFAEWKRYSTQRVWKGLMAACDRHPAKRPGDLVRHGNGLARLTKRPRGAMRYQTFVRSRRTWTATTYPTKA